VTAAAEAFVIDASVTATWLLPDEHTEASKRVYARLRANAFDAQAPDLWLWECGNIIANSVKRARVQPADAAALWGLLDAVRTRVQLSSLEPLQVRACMLLGVDYGLSIYDAAYLWLANSLKLPLLTHDKRLARNAARHEIAVLRLEDVT
jgi:predicted nucleic acid-binding protein